MFLETLYRISIIIVYVYNLVNSANIIIKYYSNNYMHNMCKQMI